MRGVTDVAGIAGICMGGGVCGRVAGVVIGRGAGARRGGCCVHPGKVCVWSGPRGPGCLR